MKHAERVTPIAAVTSALATLLCCLPIGFAAAAATASVAAVVGQLRPWLLGASVVFVAVVCGGPPQPKKSYSSTPERRCAFSSSGSRS
jgi:hypothetical protein